MNCEKNVRMLSLLGQRGACGMALTELAGTNDRIICISNDLVRTAGLERFGEKFPLRLINSGIAEQNSIGMAAGMADSGMIPFVTTFSNFATLRANEFVRHFMAYMKCNVKLVGLSSGFAMELFGTTHYGIEDVAVIRSMPNITILSPADCLETVKCIEYAASNDGPMYIRLSGGMNNPIVYKKGYDYVAGEAIKLRDGDDVALFATGSMVSVAMDVSELLYDYHIHASVHDFHTIKPIDKGTIIDKKDVPLIVTIEEHSAIGGLGSSVSEVLSEQMSHGKVIRIGTEEMYKPAGSYEYMLMSHGLTAHQIVDTIIKNCKKEALKSE